jgi:hypothetical protein
MVVQNHNQVINPVLREPSFCEEERIRSDNTVVIRQDDLARPDTGQELNRIVL